MLMFMSFVVYVIFFGVMILFNMVGNLMVCIVVLKNKVMRILINWFLFYLVIVDVFVVVFFIFCILSYFIKLLSGIVGDMLCKFLMGGVFGWVLVLVLSFLLVLIVFECYYVMLYFLKMFFCGCFLRFVLVFWIVVIFLVVLMVFLFIYWEEI